MLPGVVAVAIGLLAARLQHHLRPALGVRVLVGLAVMSVLAVAGALATATFGYLAQVPWMVDALGWCRNFARSHDAIPAWIGLPAAGTLAAMVAAVARTVRNRRRSLADLQGGEGVEVLATAQPIAFAVPGRPGRIVISDGMIELLDSSERAALFAHERSHLANRHHRYTAIAEGAAAAVPVLRSLAAQVRFATERWADEDAASEVGDRRLVASAIARAALASNGFSPANGLLALTSQGVAARVDALLVEPPSPSAFRHVVAFGLAGALLAGAGSTMQLHHLVGFASHVCNL